jgi:hypothetical protein
VWLALLEGSVKDLSGMEVEGASMFALDELERADIPRIKIGRDAAIRLSVKSQYFGCLELTDGTLATFCREPTTWMVKLSNPLPYTASRTLCDRHHTDVHAGASERPTDIPIAGCSSWQIFSQKALIAFVQTLMTHFGEISIPLAQPSVEWLVLQEMVSRALTD